MSKQLFKAGAAVTPLTNVKPEY